MIIPIGFHAFQKHYTYEYALDNVCLSRYVYMRDPKFLLIMAGILLFSPQVNFQYENSLLSPISSSTLIRNPASGEDCVEILSHFYNQDKDFIHARITNTSDLHSFYRAFVPLFYLSFLKHEKKIEKLKPLEKYISTIIGDAHFENFGLIVDDLGHVHLSLNDFDDSDESKLYYDVFRHFISSEMLTKDMNWEEYRAVYLEGVQGHQHNFSKLIESKMDSFKIDINEKINTYISKTGSPKFIKLKKPSRDLTSIEKEKLKIALTKKFPAIEIFDEYARIKTDGGSAGMLRFQVLAKITPQTELKWLDIKEMGISSIAKVFPPKKSESPIVRIKNVLTNLLGGLFNKSTSTFSFFDKTFSIRNVDQFTLGITAEDLKGDALKDVALDEAYALGVIHAKSLKANNYSVKNYSQDWQNIEHHDLTQLSDAILDDIHDLYKKSK